MNTDKSRRLLKKIQALFDNLSDQGSVSALERDLMLSYLRELYADLSDISSVTPPAEELNVYESASRAKISSSHQETEGTNPKSSAPEPIRQPSEPKVIHETPAPEEIPEHIVVTPPTTQSPAPSTQSSSIVSKVDSADLAALFEFKGTGELAEKLTLQPLDKIEHGMGINERILTINELFNGNSDLFKQTLDHLNTVTGFREAQQYLIDGVASQFGWADDAKKHKANFFIQLVRRKYVST